MNWEKSKALTPLKRDFLQAFFSKEKRFFLTGGSALGLFYLDQEGMRIEDHFNEAMQKDGGLDPAMISCMLKSLQITELPDYLIKGMSLADLTGYIEELRMRMAILAYPDEGTRYTCS